MNLYGEDVYVYIHKEDYGGDFTHIGDGIIYKIGNPEITYKMEVKSPSMSATISVLTGPYANENMVGSVLAAGIRLTDSEYEYESVVNQLKTSMGITVDRWIDPSHIAGITDTKISQDKPIHFDIEVFNGIGFTRPLAEFEMKHLIDEGSIRLELKVESDGKKFKSAMTVSDELMPIEWSDSQFNGYKKDLLGNLYSGYPEMAGVWTAIHSEYVGQSGAILYHPASEPNVLKFKTKPSSQEKVRELPGVHELVKSPVSGLTRTLQDVIIELNDNHGWSRNQVADWLETLDIDITFKPKENDEQD